MECTVLREEMMEVLYGEADAATERRVLDHQGVCAACRDEMAALRRVRAELTSWTLPAPGRTRLRLGLFGNARPLGVLAAAAALLLALGGGLGLAGSELSYQDGHLFFRLGGGQGELRALLAEQDARHRHEIQALRASLVGRDEAALLARVQDMIHASESRQAVVLNASLAALSDKSEAQRRYDMARVSAGLSYLDGRAGQQVARTAELVGYVLQASQQTPR